MKENLIKIYKKNIINNKYKINENIKSKIIKIIDIKNKKTKIIDTKNAINIAKKENLDLVEINSKVNPPICKIINFGKFIYKKYKKFKKKNKYFNLKEIKFRLNTYKNDFLIKINKIKYFIKKKNKVKITIILRGREFLYKNIAINMLEKIKNKLNNICTIISYPKKTEKKQINMIIIAKKNK